MKNLIAAILLLSTGLAFGQMNHVPGQLLVQITNDTKPEDLIRDYENRFGDDTDIQVSKLVSAPMNVYLVEFDNLALEAQIKRQVSAISTVSMCQFNHYVESRETVPNDPMLEDQWHHINDENNGGTNDADIDSDLAWDITTGGLTAAGDTIVVCVIEGGNLDHPDLKSNAWFNYNEIPDNGVDDDNNGYIDDYEGWNVASMNDDGVYQGGHGTNVMGMIGATGDNNLGVVGANWDVKIMSVAGENINDELSVVEAYTYALKQRQLYDASNGNRGAFVVATNASWGIDNGDPNQVPIWSAFYDTLGVYGILNCGATANNNVNVDVVGDIPTAAPSDYMISVTATNNNDVRTFSGYGAETIDLGAPGENVVTTAGNDGYTSTSGTSFASPLTAGVIGLLYSVPCESFIEAVHDNPQFGADYVRYALFAGVDPIENLEFETVTGGRLNAHNSLQILLGECSGDLCLDPLSFSTSQSADTVHTMSWSIIGESDIVVRMRAEGASDWTYIEAAGLESLVFDTLSYCTDYEFEIANNCDALPLADLNYILPLSISTSGCCVAPSDLLVVGQDDGADISWEAIFNVSSFEVYYRDLGEFEWIFAGTTSSNAYSISGLDTCKFYEVNVVPSCNLDLLTGMISEFRTGNCGFCIDQEFCEAYAENSSEEYIDEVQVGDYTNTSGNNGGYAFFEDTGLELEVAESYDVALSPGFTFGSYNEIFTLWLDLNQDGVFSNDEELMQSPNGSTNVFEGSIDIPANAMLGVTRMRIQMRFTNSGESTPCEVYQYGELEEYCVTITDNTSSLISISEDSAGALYPNPNNGNFTIELNLEDFQSNDYRLQVYDVTGRLVANEALNTSLSTHALNLNPGHYVCAISSEKDGFIYSGRIVIQ